MHVYNCIKFWILSQRKKQVTSYVICNNCLNFNKLCCDKFCSTLVLQTIIKTNFVMNIWISLTIQ